MLKEISQANNHTLSLTRNLKELKQGRQKKPVKPGVVVHTCNPRTGGRDKRFCHKLRPAGSK